MNDQETQTAQRQAHSAPPFSSTTWPHVLAFAQVMESKLAQNRHKGDRDGWLALDLTTLCELLSKELVELEQALSWGDANAVAEEAADVANFTMMIADKFAHQWQSSNAEMPSGAAVRLQRLVGHSLTCSNRAFWRATA